MDAATHSCKNCGQVFEKNFCNACGQKAAHRLDVKHVLHEVFHVFTHTDKGILSFIPKILLQPGVVALDYVEGRRKRYFNPFQYLVIVVGLVTLIMVKTRYVESMSRSMQSSSASERAAAVSAQLNNFVQQYFNLISFALIPVFAFFCWLFFRKRKFNYAEVFVLHTCITNQTSTISLLFILPIVFFLPAARQGEASIFLMAVSLLGQALAYRQFFKAPWIRSITISLLVYVCYMVVFSLLLGIGLITFLTLTKK